MSNNRKGSKIEAAAKRLLEQRGYLVHRTVRTPTFVAGRFLSHNNDVFGAFDLVAVHPDEPVLFVQVTVADQMSARRKKVEQVADDFPVALHCLVEVWGWVGGAKRAAKRPTSKHPFERRQFFKVSRWGGEWADRTPEDAGWID